MYNRAYSTFKLYRHGYCLIQMSKQLKSFGIKNNIWFQWVQQSIRNVTDDITNHQLLYVTHDDICGTFEGETLLAIQGPNGTQLEVPRPELSTVPGQKHRYQVFVQVQDHLCQVFAITRTITKQWILALKGSFVLRTKKCFGFDFCKVNFHFD